MNGRAVVSKPRSSYSPTPANQHGDQVGAHRRAIEPTPQARQNVITVIPSAEPAGALGTTGTSAGAGVIPTITIFAGRPSPSTTTTKPARCGDCCVAGATRVSARCATTQRRCVRTRRAAYIELGNGNEERSGACQVSLSQSLPDPLDLTAGHVEVGGQVRSGTLFWSY